MSLVIADLLGDRQAVSLVTADILGGREADCRMWEGIRLLICPRFRSLQGSWKSARKVELGRLGRS